MLVAFHKLFSSHSRVVHMGQSLESLYLFVFRQNMKHPPDPVKLISKPCLFLSYIYQKSCIMDSHLCFPHRVLYCVIINNFKTIHTSQRGNEHAKILSQSAISLIPLRNQYTFPSIFKSVFEKYIIFAEDPICYQKF